jgi:hypothetical protein
MIKMQQISLGVGGALIALGLIATIATGFNSFTSLIPTVLGAILVGLALLGRDPEKRKLAAHIAAAVGLLGLLGSLRVLGALPDFFSGDGEASGWAVMSQLITIVLCGYHTFASVQSFRAARAER